MDRGDRILRGAGGDAFVRVVALAAAQLNLTFEPEERILTR